MTLEVDGRQLRVLPAQPRDGGGTASLFVLRDVIALVRSVHGIEKNFLAAFGDAAAAAPDLVAVMIVGKKPYTKPLLCVFADGADAFLLAYSQQKRAGPACGLAMGLAKVRALHDAVAQMHARASADERSDDDEGAEGGAEGAALPGAIAWVATFTVRRPHKRHSRTPSPPTPPAPR